MISKQPLPQLFFFALFLFLGYTSIAQIAISPDGSAPDNSAMFHIKSTTQGFLTPRMTTSQRTVIASPANGLLVYDITTNSFWFFKNGLGWKEMTSSYWLPDTNGIHYSAGRIGVGILPDQNTPIKVLQANSGVGGSVFEGSSNDVWHTAITMQNNPLNARYTFIISGPTNTNLLPGSFGLFNHQNLKWIFVSNRINNNLGIGVPTINAPVPKSTLHVLTGDINIEQIGNGVIMKSPNGDCWRYTPDNNGNLVGVAITCP